MISSVMACFWDEDHSSLDRYLALRCVVLTYISYSSCCLVLLIIFPSPSDLIHSFAFLVATLAPFQADPCSSIPAGHSGNSGITWVDVGPTCLSSVLCVNHNNVCKIPGGQLWVMCDAQRRCVSSFQTLHRLPYGIRTIQRTFIMPC